ncbi:MAG: LysM peptidoglycan-binding domain-containing protein [Brevefilum sp.]
MRQAIKKTITITLSLFLAGALHFKPVLAGSASNAAFFPNREGLKQEDTPVPIAPVITSTPNSDGIIIHTVQYGETLYTISEAYEVPIDQILSNTGLSQTTTEIREGQELVIQTAQEPTPTNTPTPTEVPDTPTPTQPRPTLTPFPTRTPAPTFTPTPTPSFIHRTLGQGTYVGIGLVLVCGTGLLLVVYRGFLKKT